MDEHKFPPSFEDRVQAQFNWVRHHFFPRWRSANKWEVIADDPPGDRGLSLEGYCDIKHKKIYIVRPRGLKDLRRLIIHEICHTVAQPCHGKRFWARMYKAADEAERLGLPDLTQAVREDADNCLKASPLRAQEIYDKVEAIVQENDGQLPFEVIKRSARQAFGLTGEEVDRRARRLEAIYEKAMQEWHEGQQMQARLRAMLEAQAA